MSTGQVEQEWMQKPLPPPGAEAVGPPLTDLVIEMRRAAQAMEALYRQAKLEALERLQTGVTQGVTDGNGDAVLRIFEVPQACTGYLMLCAVDEAGVTPATPDTSATLWHAIYAGGAGSPTAAQVTAVGNQLDQIPNSPTVDGQIPFTYIYADRYSAPALVGPGVFYLVIDAATATRQVAARYQVLVVQVEP